MTPAIGRDFADVAREGVLHPPGIWSHEECTEITLHSNKYDQVVTILHYGRDKRGMRGVYQHCSEKHLHRYLAEFDFRYNNRMALGVNDEQRAAAIVKGIVGKRLTYRTTSGTGPQA